MINKKDIDNKLANILWEFRHCKNAEDIMEDRIECINSLFGTTLKSNDIILAKGKVKLSCDNRDYFIGDEITLPLAYTGGAVKEELGKLEGKTIILKAVIGEWVN